IFARIPRPEIEYHLAGDLRIKVREDRPRTGFRDAPAREIDGSAREHPILDKIQLIRVVVQADSRTDTAQFSGISKLVRVLVLLRITKVIEIGHGQAVDVGSDVRLCVPVAGNIDDLPIPETDILPRVQRHALPVDLVEATKVHVDCETVATIEATVVVRR